MQARRLFDLASSPILLFAGASFFLPLLVVSCGEVRVEFSGPNLALGSRPTMEGFPEVAQAAVDAPPRNSEMRDLPAAFIPILAFLSAVISVHAFMHREAGALRVVRLAFLGALVSLFAWYAVVGFKIERDLRDAMKAKSSPDSVGIPEGLIEWHKTVWFWLALVCATGSLALAFFRDSSPPLFVDPPPVEIVDIPSRRPGG